MAFYLPLLYTRHGNQYFSYSAKHLNYEQNARIGLLQHHSDIKSNSSVQANVFHDKIIELIY